MSVCIETSNVLASSSAVGTVSSSSPTSSSSNSLDETVASSVSNTQSSTVISTIVSQATVSTNIIQAPIVATNTTQSADGGGESKQEPKEQPFTSVPVAPPLPQPQIPSKSIAKLVVANHSSSNNCGAVLQKVVTPPLITVLNPSGPLTVVKTLCVTSGVSSAPQFTLVNSTPLNVTNTVGKPPTITLLNAPVTVVKAITHAQQPVEKTSDVSVAAAPGGATNTTATTIIENRGAHNVFVKNTCSDGAGVDMPQSHKLLTANNFPQTNVFANIGQQQAPHKTVNGQRNKLKILSNVVVPGTSQPPPNNILLSSKNGAAPPQHRLVSKHKLLSANGAKYINKSQPNNLIKSGTVNAPMKLMQDKSSPSLYPTHKGQLKTLPPMNAAGYMQKPPPGIKTLPPQNKTIPAGQMQRTGLGVRTIPPQRQQKLPNKTNYIGKHAIQAQKMRQPHGGSKMKGMKMAPTQPYNIHAPPSIPENKMTELTFNQALTAQIIETLSNPSAPLPSHRNEPLPMRYNNAFSCPESKMSPHESQKLIDDGNKAKSGLDALSLICQAVLLDHNYNATLPPDTPSPRPSPPIASQVNGMAPVSGYNPINNKIITGRPLPTLNVLSSTSISSSMSSSLSSSTNSQTSLTNCLDDDAASDISDGSLRKHDTEGEETDTAPEAEAVNNESFDGGYGDYVTRCLCGYLHDDGYMVECDGCKVWQHVQCVIKNRQIPEEYLCEVCDPTKPIDRQNARLIQQQWLRDRQFLDPKLRKTPKLKEVFKAKEMISDTDSSDGEQIAHNNNVAKARGAPNRRKSESQQQKQTMARQRRENAKETTQKRQKRKERKIVRKKIRTKAAAKAQSDDENQQDTWASHLPQLRQWIEKYEEAVTNHYSPELRARISNIRVNGAHSDGNMQFDPTVNKCRVHTQPLTEIKYLVATVYLPPNTPIIELRGKYMLSTQHRNSGGSLTTRQHSQRPGPFLFFYQIQRENTEVCVDTRTYGNAARFIRRSCKPNAELRPCIEKGVLHLYVVSTAAVEKNCELTIKHESHDLAAIGTTQIACACGNIRECLVNNSNTSVKKNGEVNNEAKNDFGTMKNIRKRRGRRTASSTETPTPAPPPVTKAAVKEEPSTSSLSPPSSASVACLSPTTEEKPEVKVEPQAPEDVVDAPPPVKNEVKVEIKEEKVEVEEKETITPTTATDANEVKEIKEEPVEEATSVDSTPPQQQQQQQEEVKKEKKEVKEEEIKSPPRTPISTRRSSHYKSDKEEEKVDPKEEKSKSKKMSREERKLAAILKAIEQMEKADLRKQEHQAKQAHRRESEPGPNPKEEDKQEPKMKRRRRKGRARTVSQSAASRRNRLNSTDSYMTSGDENLLSPVDSNQGVVKKETTADATDSRAVGLLLALSNGDKQHQHEKSPPPREIDSNSNSAHSSPETQLSSACLLVQAAVEPLEPGFKFPKTKKGLMNEWLNKGPENMVSPTSHLHSSSDMDVGGFYSGPSKNLAALAQAATYCDTNTSLHPRGNAKKRWLRQAIREDHSCDSPSSRPESPPLNDMVAPPKKRRLPRESLSNDVSPPTTPVSTTAPPMFINKSDESPNQEGNVEIVYGGESPSQSQMESDAILKERAAKMKQEFALSAPPQPEITPMGRLMDPRLNRDGMFSNTDLIGTVEKTLSILGLDNGSKPEPVVPKKKVKLSISEYRQRKMQTFPDKVEEPEPEQEPEPVSTEENNSVDSFKAAPRPRTTSMSSSTSLSSSDDEFSAREIPVKAPVFNSEPTELERQRETSSLRLKRAFGLKTDTPRPTINVDALLSLELEPKVKPTLPLPSPTFPIPGSSEITRDRVSRQVSLSPEEVLSTAPVVPVPQRSRSPESTLSEEEADEGDNATREPDGIEQVNEEKNEKEDSGNDETAPPNLFYTPDEEEHKEHVFEETDSISYVPPFNNPIYPNDGFAYTSTIDDDARYEGRNPSPPPNL